MVGMYLREGLMREWKGWDVFEGKFNEKMEKLCILESKFNEIMERLGVLEVKFNE
jgi:hypothetical protein